MKEELLKGLTEEQIAKVKACKNQEEVLALVREEGIELTDEQLEAVSGGNCMIPSFRSDKPCPICGTYNCQTIRSAQDGTIEYYYCNECNKHFYPY